MFLVKYGTVLRGQVVRPTVTLPGLPDFPLHSGKSLGPPYTVSIALRGFVARPPIALGEVRVAAQPPTALGEEPGELYLVQERDVQKR